MATRATLKAGLVLAMLPVLATLLVLCLCVLSPALLVVWLGVRVARR